MLYVCFTEKEMQSPLTLYEKNKCDDESLDKSNHNLAL